MKFGIRECANVVFRAKQNMKIGNNEFKMGQPVLYIDSATTSTVEQASTTVYAQGGRGNVRLIAWEGEKTLTFTVEDALLSPISLAMLSGADLFKGAVGTSDKVHFHTTSNIGSIIKAETDTTKYYTYTKSGSTWSSEEATVATGSLILNLSSVLGATETICNSNDAPIYVIATENDGSLTGSLVEGTVQVLGTQAVTSAATEPNYQVIAIASPTMGGVAVTEAATYFVDYYLDKNAAQVDELQIAGDNFAGSYYVEADTLWRSQANGIDYPANLTFPNVKIQSNFTFSLSSTGDPSTFTFTMDAFPGYTYFDKTRQVLCVIQVVNDATSATKTVNPVMPHNVAAEHALNDSNYLGYGNGTTSTKYTTEQWAEIGETEPNG